MRITREVAGRSTCLRRQVGAVLVLDRRLLATGYNGSPSGLPHCAEVGCLRQARGVASGERHELCRGLHAEMNVLIQAALYGIPVRGATLYCTNAPCSLCAKMLINARIERIVAGDDYPDPLAREMLQQTNIKFEIVQAPREE